MTWFKKKLKSLVTICLAAFLIVSVLPQTSVRAAETGGTSEMALGSDISAAADSDREYTNKDGISKKLYDICKNDYGMNAGFVPGLIIVKEAAMKTVLLPMQRNVMKQGLRLCLTSTMQIIGLIQENSHHHLHGM